jgi:HEAT repeats
LAGLIAWFVIGSRRIGAARSALPPSLTALIAAAIGLGGLTLAHGAAAEPPAARANLEVTVAGGWLSVRVDEAPFDAVLEAIAAQTELAITIRGDPGTVGPQEFADLPLESGIRRLAGERRLMMVFERSDDQHEPGRLKEVQVYSDPPSDDLARPRYPLTRTFGKVAKQPPLAAPERPGYQELAAKDKSERLGAIRGLARQKNDAAIEVLGALLAHDPDRTVRRIAASALGNIGGEAVVSALETALVDQDVDVRIQAMRGLHVINGTAATGTLGELALGDADPELRRQAVHLLATLRSDEARSTIGLAATDPDDSVRQAAEEALTRRRRSR